MILEFVLWTVGLLVLLGSAVYALNRAIHRDTWDYDNQHVWQDFNKPGDRQFPQ